MRTLIAVNDPASSEVLEETLSAYGEAATVTNRSDATKEFLRAIKQGQPYQLVCLDEIMADVNGHGVVNEMRKLEAGRRVPESATAKIIMITEFGDPTDIVDELSGDWEGHLVKPMDTEKLQSIIESLSGDCDAYLVRPFDKQEVLGKLTHLGLIGSDAQS